MPKKDIYYLPSLVLFILGIIDLVRGFMHTFLLRFSAETFAQLNLVTNPNDQLFLLGILRNIKLPYRSFIHTN